MANRASRAIKRGTQRDTYTYIHTEREREKEKERGVPPTRRERPRVADSCRPRRS